MRLRMTMSSAIFIAVAVLCFQNCSAGLQTLDLQSDLVNGSRLRGDSVAAAKLPAGFGVALEAPFYNPKGAIQNVLVDGANDTLAMGIQTFKIHLSFQIVAPINNANFYRLPQEPLSAARSLVDMVKIKEIEQVLDLPFHTIFIDADNVDVSDGKGGLVGRTAHYLSFDTVAMSASDKAKVYQQIYDLSKYLLSRYAGTDRTFVIQNHEGDSHTTLDAFPHGDPTAIGLQNFRDYWRIRQAAVNAARAEVVSSAKIYHMCEIVKVRKLLIDGPASATSKSLLRDVLPNTQCDLIGYSAHDTAIDGSNDGTVNFNLIRAVNLIKQYSKPSAAFGRNNVVLSEIAVPELLEGAYVGQTAGVARTIHEYIQGGMPYILYWALYTNGKNAAGTQYDGNWLRRPDGSESLMMTTLRNEFANPIGELPTATPTATPIVVSPTPTATPVIVTPTPTTTPIIVTPTPTIPPKVACVDHHLISPTAAVPSGVRADIKLMYDEVLGGIGSYIAGAQYLSSLAYQGYTIPSLRNDLIKESAVLNKTNELYAHYLKRPIHPVDFENVKAHLRSGGTIRQIELMIVNDAGCFQ